MEGFKNWETVEDMPEDLVGTMLVNQVFNQDSPELIDWFRASYCTDNESIYNLLKLLGVDFVKLKSEGGDVESLVKPIGELLRAANELRAIGQLTVFEGKEHEAYQFTDKINEALYSLLKQYT